MNKFSHEEGLTLIELLITLAVIAIVFAIAVPVFSNVLAGAQTSADSAQASALSAFHDEYASTTLAYANGVTTATLNGVQIASIKGDATGSAVAGASAALLAARAAVDGLPSGANDPIMAEWSVTNPILMIVDTGSGQTYFAYSTRADMESMMAARTDRSDAYSVIVDSNGFIVMESQFRITSPVRTETFIELSGPLASDSTQVVPLADPGYGVVTF